MFTSFEKETIKEAQHQHRRCTVNWRLRKQPSKENISKHSRFLNLTRFWLFKQIQRVDFLNYKTNMAREVTLQSVKLSLFNVESNGKKFWQLHQNKCVNKYFMINRTI